MIKKPIRPRGPRRGYAESEVRCQFKNTTNDEDCKGYYIFRNAGAMMEDYNGKMRSKEWV